MALIYRTFSKRNHLREDTIPLIPSSSPDSPEVRRIHQEKKDDNDNTVKISPITVNLHTILNNPQLLKKIYLINDSTRDEFISKISVIIMPKLTYFVGLVELKKIMKKIVGRVNISVGTVGNQSDMMINDVKQNCHGKLPTIPTFLAHRFFNDDQTFNSISSPNQNMLYPKID